MTKSVLFAGVLGGVLGAVFAFGLARALPTPTKPPPPTPQSEARPLADELIAKLKAGKNDEFFNGVSAAFSGANQEQLGQLKQSLLKLREDPAKAYGPSLDFEFVRENTVGPNLVRFAYLEKFPHGCVVWIIVLYNASDGWQVLGYKQLPLETAFEALR